jgi:hypothetical protein
MASFQITIALLKANDKRKDAVYPVGDVSVVVATLPSVNV